MRNDVQASHRKACALSTTQPIQALPEDYLTSTRSYLLCYPFTQQKHNYSPTLKWCGEERTAAVLQAGREQKEAALVLERGIAMAEASLAELPG